VGISCQEAGPFGDLQFSSKVIDYLSQGLPVVTSRTKTLVRYIPEDAVFYFKPGNEVDMAEKVVYLWDHPDIVKRKMDRAMSLFPLYTWQAERQKLIQIYRGLLINLV
jgi:glycosyltransferase involved in cell wall biosynthesis